MIVYVSGSSGVGKNTLIAKLVEKEKNIKFITSYTTREKRPFETDGVQYHFVTKDAFQKLNENHQIVEYDLVHGNYYGHALSAIDEDFKEFDVVMKDLSVGGVDKAKEVIEDKYPVLSIFLTADKAVLKQRLLGRGEKDIKRRLNVYKKEQKAALGYDYVVHNDEVDRTIEVLKAIIKETRMCKSLLPMKSCQTLSHARIEKIENRLLKGKKVKPIVVAEGNGKLYIVDGRHTYLASLKCGVHVACLVDSNAMVTPLDKAEQDEWAKIVKNYTK